MYYNILSKFFETLEIPEREKGSEDLGEGFGALESTQLTQPHLIRSLKCSADLVWSFEVLPFVSIGTEMSDGTSPEHSRDKSIWRSDLSIAVLSSVNTLLYPMAGFPTYLIIEIVHFGVV